MADASTLIAALEAAHAALDRATVCDEAGGVVGWVAAAGMSAEELCRAVCLEARLEARVAGLKLHTVAAAEAAGAASASAAADTGAWAASAAGRTRSRSWGAVWLANLLDEKYPHTRAALAGGRISEEHAAVIVRAAEAVPDGVTPADLALCEERLVAKAETMCPRRLRRAARRLLEPLSRQLADVHEEGLLLQQERHAEAETWLTLGDNGDGTYSGRFTVPELHGILLRTALETLSSPRRYGRDRSGRPVEDPTIPGMGARLSWPEALGAAFVELLEHLPTTGHTRSGVTLVVHVDEDELRAGAGSATLPTGAAISVAEARRLACEAGQLPLVLSGRSQPLDLGASTRLFSRAQALALSAVHDTCAAEGCERPFAWSELHHLRPWGEGGPTDLANAVPLCGFHHRRIHDNRYHHERQPDGSIRFRHRWPSRRRDPFDVRPAA
jgi:hypothetical protein